MSTSICIISTKTPYHGQFAREALDAALVSASYDLPTSLLLMGDGVYQLLSHQTPDLLPRKNLSALFQSLPLYGIDSIHVDTASLEERNITAEQLQSPYTLVDTGKLSAFIQQHDRVLNF